MSNANIFGDFPLAIRGLRRSPVFSSTAILAIGLGIGVCSAVFSMVNALMLQPLPFPQPKQLFHVWRTDTSQDWDQLYVSAPTFGEIQERIPDIQQVGGFANRQISLAGRDGYAVQVTAAEVTGDLFATLGVGPILGRVLTDEDVRNSSRVAVISHALWQRRFGGIRDILGRRIRLNTQPYTVVGVMPEAFKFPMLTTQVWIPTAPLTREIREDASYQVVARLKSGAELQRVKRQFDNLARSLAERFPDIHDQTGFNVVPLRQALLFDYDRVAMVARALTAAVVFALLLVCANVANLLLVRFTARARDLAIQNALGATRARLLRLLLSESVLLSLLGGGLGLLLAGLFVRAGAAFVPEDLYRVGSFSLSVPTAVCALGLALLTAVLVGLFPALEASRGSLFSILGGREGLGNRRMNRRFGLLVVLQLAIGTVLLVGALLMIHSIQNLRQVNAGFDPGVLAFQLNIPAGKYESSGERARFIDTARAAVERVPGVARGAAVNFLPMNNETLWRNLRIEGGGHTEGEEPAAIFLYASQGYFSTLGVPILRGRGIGARDTDSSMPVAVVNHAFAKRYAKDGNIVGQRISVAREGREPAWRTVVGVVADYHHVSLRGAVNPQVFVPLFQRPWTYLRLLARVEGDGAGLIPEIRRTIRQLDPDVPVGDARRLRELRAEWLSTERFVSSMLLGLGAGALLVLAMGLYGIMAFRMIRHIPEIGLRMALGADRRRILKMVLGEAGRLTLFGLLLGLSGAAVASLGLSRFLYRIQPLDPVTYLVIAAILTCVGLAAGYVPAWRASRVNPVEALRHE